MPHSPRKIPKGAKGRSEDKEKVRLWAIAERRKVLWKDENGYWHAATNRLNTPQRATETEDI